VIHPVLAAGLTRSPLRRFAVDRAQGDRVTGGDEHAFGGAQHLDHELSANIDARRCGREATSAQSRKQARCL
jgi:hypothetical protein